jgi:hypothetical protein
MRASEQEPADARDAALWQRSAATDVAEDEEARFLDLAAFAEERLDPDDAERVSAWLARDPVAAADVLAARAAFAGGAASNPAVSSAVAARAAALIGSSDPSSDVNVIAFPLSQQRAVPRWHHVTSWGSLAAAVALAGWLGFTLGIDTSLAIAPNAATGQAGFLQDLLDTPSGLVGDLTESTQS